MGHIWTLPVSQSNGLMGHPLLNSKIGKFNWTPIVKSAE